MLSSPYIDLLRAALACHAVQCQHISMPDDLDVEDLEMEFTLELWILSHLQVVLASQHFILVLVPTISYLQQIGTKNMVCSG